MALSPELLTFIQSAVRLPPEVLKRIDRDWDRLYPHRLVLTELVQGSDELRRDASELREYVLAEARRAAAERPGEQLIPEDASEVVVPAARALLMRETGELGRSATSSRVRGTHGAVSGHSPRCSPENWGLRENEAEQFQAEASSEGAS